MRRLLLMCVVFLLTACSLAEAAQVLRAERPEWVIQHELAEPKPERLRQLEDGQYYLLHDRQVRWDGETEVFFHRVAYRITERAGLEAGSSITRHFDPSYQNVTLHSAEIRRGDDVIDLTDRLEFTIIRRETELDSGILDGDLTAHVYLPAVQVGDVVDLQFSWASDPHIGKGQFSAAFRPIYSIPVGAMHYRVVWPAGLPMHLRKTGVDLEPTRLNGPDWNEYRWEQFDPEPKLSEREVPNWHPRWGRVSISSLDQWSDVVDDLLPHYLPDVDLPDAFLTRLDGIASATDDPALRMSRALRLVQDDIRYVGIEIGRGAFIPRTPQVTWAKGYGDCKDKSVLLAAGLRYLGVDAVPALTHLKRGRGLEDRLPSVAAFNHMIVRADIDDTVFWLDPTDSYQGGEGAEVVQANPGYGLALRPGQSTLEPIPDIEPEEPTSKTVEIFEFGEDGEPVRLNVVTTRTAHSADWMRRRLAHKSRAAIARSYLEYYDRYYPGMQRVGTMQIADDRDANLLTVTETYELPWKAFTRDGLNENFPMRGGELINVLENPSVATKRRNPLWQPAALHYSHQVIFRNTPFRYNAPDIRTYRNEHFSLHQLSKSNDDVLSVTWTLKTLAPEVAADDVESYVAHVNAMEDDVTWFYDLTSTGSKASESAADKTKDGPRLRGLEQLVDWFSQKSE